MERAGGQSKDGLWLSFSQIKIKSSKYLSSYTQWHGKEKTDIEGYTEVQQENILSIHYYGTRLTVVQWNAHLRKINKPNTHQHEGTSKNHGWEKGKLQDDTGSIAVFRRTLETQHCGLWRHIQKNKPDCKDTHQTVSSGWAWVREGNMRLEEEKGVFRYSVPSFLCHTYTRTHAHTHARTLGEKNM